MRPPGSPKPSAPNEDDDCKPMTVNPPVFDSKALFRDAREVQIMHRGEIYRLQRTRGGKLILVK